MFLKNEITKLYDLKIVKLHLKSLILEYNYLKITFDKTYDALVTVLVYREIILATKFLQNFVPDTR